MTDALFGFAGAILCMWLEAQIDSWHERMRDQRRAKYATRPHPYI
jgi:hypothetical protein